VEGDAPGAFAIGPDAQRDLLRHGPGWHEDGGLLAEELRHLPLEAGDELALAVVVGGRIVGDAGGEGAQDIRGVLVPGPW
jgi:hypothetical protein